jgi:hypothetical protein
MPIFENQIPVIDCSCILGPLEEIEDSEAFKAFTKQLGDGMSQVGFVYFVNHGIHPSKVRRNYKQKCFFMLKQRKWIIIHCNGIIGARSSVEMLGVLQLATGDKNEVQEVGCCRELPRIYCTGRRDVRESVRTIESFSLIQWTHGKWVRKLIIVSTT